MNYPILNHVIIVLLLVLFVGIVFRTLRLPQILGYLAVGAFVGPHGMGWIKDVNDAHQLAGFGVVFLMFTVGLEFSFAKMKSLKVAVTILGGSQVLLCSLIGLAIGVFLLKIPWYAALIAGAILAMSSTAITVKQLSEQFELNSTQGQNALGVLLFQDIAVIPFFILIGSLGVINATPPALFSTLLTAIFKAILALAIILALGKWLLRRLFHTIAATRVIELFTLAVLLVTLASAWISEKFGLSFALGAFLAGMMLSETKFRHQIEVEIRPFRDLLLGLFFITIGMLVNFSRWAQYWPWIMITFLSFMTIKVIVVMLLSKLLGIEKFIAFRTGLILAQGGEFGFAMLTLALTNRLFPPGYGQTLLGALLLSFGIAPLLITYNRQIAKFIFPTIPALTHADAIKKISKETAASKNHVIVCGYGQVGQNITALLEQEQIPYLALDLDPEHIREASLAGKPVTYGDATHPGLLTAAGIGQARSLVISFDDPRAAAKVLEHVNNINPNLHGNRARV
ncbi:MAG: cation:proton antiporter [Proteobacteria bacterium]|nr:cation:proton antiporter [Pseudomonadota bacterium]